MRSETVETAPEQLGPLKSSDCADTMVWCPPDMHDNLPVGTDIPALGAKVAVQFGGDQSGVFVGMVTKFYKRGGKSKRGRNVKTFDVFFDIDGEPLPRARAPPTAAPRYLPTPPNACRHGSPTTSEARAHGWVGGGGGGGWVGGN